jgi:hypothetical protein
MATGTAARPAGRDRVGRAVAGLDVMLEQPCATLEDCAAVRAATGLPMKLDELAHDTGLAAQGARARLHGCRRAQDCRNSAG